MITEDGAKQLHGQTSCLLLQRSCHHMGGALIKILDGVTSVEACRERAHAAHSCFNNCDPALNVTASSSEDVATFQTETFVHDILKRWRSWCISGLVPVQDCCNGIACAVQNGTCRNSSLSLSIHISLALSLPIRRHAQRRLSNSNVYICLQFEDSIPFKVCQHAGRPQGNYRRPIWADEKDKVGQQEYIHVYTVCSQEFVYWNMRQDLNKTSFLELVDIVRNVVDDPRVSCVRGFDKSLARSSFKMRPFHLHSSAMAALE